MSKKRKIAILGCGGMGSGHARALGGKGGYTDTFSYRVYYEGQVEITKLDDKLELAGIYDIDDKRIQWAKENGFHCYKNYEDMLNDKEVDIILIATPNHLHKEQTIQAMRAGKHVLCEKPVMMSSAELEEVMQVAKETGKIFYPRQNRRWDRDFLTIKKIYDEKMLGENFNVECHVMGSRGIPGDWRAKKEFGGGMILDWGVHLLDRLLHMVPEKIKYVFCSTTNVTNDEVDDGFKMHLTFESGFTALMEVGTCNFISMPLWYLAGNEGTAVIYDWNCNGKIVRVKSWEDKDAVPILAGEGLTKTMAPRGDDTTIEYQLPEVVVDRNALYANVVDTINGDAKQLVTAEEALRVLRLMEACFESAEKHTVVNFE